MNNVFLIIGGNLGDRKQNLSHALYLIEQSAGYIKKLSSIYETEPWGVQGQPDYYNQVVELLTELNADTLMQALLSIEKQMGRQRIAKNDARTMDIDILFFNDEIYNSKLISIPHPRLHQRRFVLAPLAEIAPEFIHPVLNKPVSLLLKECDDAGTVTKV